MRRASVFLLNFFILLHSSLSFAPSVAGAAVREDRVIRVELMTRVYSLTLGPGRYISENVQTKTKQKVAWSSAAKVSAGKQGLVIQGESYGWRLRLETQDQSDFVNVKGRDYRGKIELMCNARGQITVVNILDVDDYVKGILVHEANPAWPMEALKGQSIVSRTYALRNRGRHGKNGYDFCKTSHCQVYGGKVSEHARSNQAVEKTAGEVLTYKGELVTAVFHSSCGGSTELAKNVWQGGGAPYLNSVRCKWCKGTKNYRWEMDVSKDDMERKLTQAGFRLGKIKSIKVVSRSPSRRVDAVQVRGTKGRADIPANRFRLIVDSRRIRSTLWTGISSRGKAWHFFGKGWGHGVGLCQWGMKVLADKGYSYKRILKFYYRGSKVQKKRK